MCKLLYLQLANLLRNFGDSFRAHFFTWDAKFRGQTLCFGMYGHFILVEVGRLRGSLLKQSQSDIWAYFNTYNSKYQTLPINLLHSQSIIIITIKPWTRPCKIPPPPPHPYFRTNNNNNPSQPPSSIAQPTPAPASTAASKNPSKCRLVYHWSLQPWGWGRSLPRYWRLWRRMSVFCRIWKIVSGSISNQNQIELKLYYEHLQDIVTNLRKQKHEHTDLINTLKTQLTVLKQKQKYYLTISNNNTRNNDEYLHGGNLESKLDTITKIKNRLSLNGTEEFYSNYLVAKKVERDSDTRELRDKRESLANALKELYDSPIQCKDKSKSKSKSKGKDKQKQKDRAKCYRSINKSGQYSHTSSVQSLSKNKSRKSLTNITSTQKPTDRQREKRLIKKQKQKKQQKNYLKGTFTAVSSRRNSRI